MDDTRYDEPTQTGRTEQQQAIGYAPRGVRTSRSTDQWPDRQAPTSRVDRIRARVTEAVSTRGAGELEHRVRAHPLAALAIAAGVGFVLYRANVAAQDEYEYELMPLEERLLAWLEDAYALEKAQVAILKDHAAAARSQPHVRRMQLDHRDRTKDHVKQVKECIELLGRKPSKKKGAAARIAAAVNSITTEPFDDEVVRNFIADFATENLEIASYEAIVVAARDAGHERIARICEDILEDEEEMVDWLRSNLPRAVRDTLGELDISQSRWS